MQPTDGLLPTAGLARHRTLEEALRQVLCPSAWLAALHIRGLDSKESREGFLSSSLTSFIYLFVCFFFLYFSLPNLQAYSDVKNECLKMMLLAWFLWFLTFYYFLFVCMCVCYQGQCPQRPEGDVSFPGTGVRSGCELHCMGTGTKTMVLCKTSKRS